jgi:hypothetical protein
VAGGTKPPEWEVFRVFRNLTQVRFELHVKIYYTSPFRTINPPPPHTHITFQRNQLIRDLRIHDFEDIDCGLVCCVMTSMFRVDEKYRRWDGQIEKYLPITSVISVSNAKKTLQHEWRHCPQAFFANLHSSFVSDTYVPLSELSSVQYCN